MPSYQVPTPARPSNQGFTLVELMVVVAILGILAAIAYPAYTSYVLRGNRSAAQSYMMDVAQAQQQYLLDSRSYADEAAITVIVPKPKIVSDNYTIAITPDAGPPPKFTIALTATGKQAKDGDLKLTEDGKKTPADKW